MREEVSCLFLILCLVATVVSFWCLYLVVFRDAVTMQFLMSFLMYIQPATGLVALLNILCVVWVSLLCVFLRVPWGGLWFSRSNVWLAF